MEFFRTFDPQKDDFGTVVKNTKVLHVPSSLNGSTDLGQFYQQLAAKAGYPLICEEDPLTGKLSWGSWTEIKYEKGVNTYKSSNTHQPLHTDYGYFSLTLDWSFFYCLEQAVFGGATTFIDVDTLVEMLGALDPVLLQKLVSVELSNGRSGNQFASKKDTVLKKDTSGEWLINWNYYRAKNDSENAELVESFRHFLETYVERSGELLQLKLKPGEGVFFQDRRVLHGRNSFVGTRHLNKGAICLTDPSLYLVS